MTSTPDSDSTEEKKSFKMMLLALVTAIVAIIQAVVRKPFRR